MMARVIIRVSLLMVIIWLAGLLIPLLAKTGDWYAVLPGFVITTTLFVFLAIYFIRNFQEPYIEANSSGQKRGANTFTPFIFLVSAPFLLSAFSNMDTGIAVILTLASLGGSYLIFRVLPFIRKGKWNISLYIMVLCSVTILAPVIIIFGLAASEYPTEYYISNFLIVVETYLLAIVSGLNMNLKLEKNTGPTPEQSNHISSTPTSKLIADLSWKSPVESSHYVTKVGLPREYTLIPHLEKLKDQLPVSWYRWHDWKGEQTREFRAAIEKAIDKIVDYNIQFQANPSHAWCTGCRCRATLRTYGRMEIVLCPVCGSDIHLMADKKYIVAIAEPDAVQDQENGFEVSIWDSPRKAIFPAEFDILRIKNSGQETEWFIAAFCVWWENLPAKEKTAITVEVVPGITLSDNSKLLLENLQPKPKFATG